MEMEKREKYKCKRCGWEWFSRKKTKPITCPHCRTPYWDIDRIYKLKKKTK
jgi:DNA-directed RNA polymerase subunit RPC12/RpoP